MGQQVRRTLEPASRELSLKAIEDVRRERERRRRPWEQRLERPRDEAERAERPYNAVEPANRLVARGLERRWEEARRNQRDVPEEEDRVLTEQPRQVSGDETARVLALAGDVPARWGVSETTAADRQEVVRRLVDRVVVHVRPDSERAEVTLSGKGGGTTRHEIVRSVLRSESLSDDDRLMDRIIPRRRDGLTIAEVAAPLNREGFRTPMSRKGSTPTSVRTLMSRRGLTRRRTNSQKIELG